MRQLPEIERAAIAQILAEFKEATKDSTSHFMLSAPEFLITLSELVREGKTETNLTPAEIYSLTEQNVTQVSTEGGHAFASSPVQIAFNKLSKALEPHGEAFSQLIAAGIKPSETNFALLFSSIAEVRDSVLSKPTSVLASATACGAGVKAGDGATVTDTRALPEHSVGAKVLSRHADLINDFSNESLSAFSVDDMTVAIATKNASRTARGLLFNCLAVEREDSIDELAELLTTLNTKAIAEPAKDFRLQILYKTILHWSTLDISFKAGQFSVYSVDPANDLSVLIDVMPLLVSKLPPSALFYYTGGPFQADDENCAIFAFDHASCLARIPDLHKQLTKFEKNPSVGYFKTFAEYIMGILGENDRNIRSSLNSQPFLRTIENSAKIAKISHAMTKLTYITPARLNGDLAPLVRNIQSLDNLKLYFKMNPSLRTSKGGYRNETTLIGKITDHTRLFEETKLRNYSAADKKISVKKKTSAYLKALTDGSCMLLLSQRKSLPAEVSIAKAEADAPPPAGGLKKPC